MSHTKEDVKQKRQAEKNVGCIRFPIYTQTVTCFLTNPEGIFQKLCLKGQTAKENYPGVGKA